MCALGSAVRDRLTSEREGQKRAAPVQDWGRRRTCSAPVVYRLVQQSGLEVVVRSRHLLHVDALRKRGLNEPSTTRRALLGRWSDEGEGLVDGRALPCCVWADEG